MNKETNNPNIKVSSCQFCKGVVRLSVLPMDKKAEKEFSAEVFKYNLSVSEITLSDYNSRSNPWCKCK